MLIQVVWMAIFLNRSRFTYFQVSVNISYVNVCPPRVRQQIFIGFELKFESSSPAALQQQKSHRHNLILGSLSQAPGTLIPRGYELTIAAVTNSRHLPSRFVVNLEVINLDIDIDNDAAGIMKDGKLKRKYVTEELLKRKGCAKGGGQRRNTSESSDSTNFSDESEQGW